MSAHPDGEHQREQRKEGRPAKRSAAAPAYWIVLDDPDLCDVSIMRPHSRGREIRR
jgi:hypothetical protein